jgi:hypothetical protein
MGLHSTLFGPVKFAYLPQHLNERELTGGNGMVEMGTFVAILLGNVAGGLLISIPGGTHYVAVACIAVALLGRLTAQAVPPSPSTDPGLVINWNPVSETWRNLKLAHGNLVVFRSLLGISWMWFFGAAFLAQFRGFAKSCTATSRCALWSSWRFSIGIGVGSLLCEVLSRHRRNRPRAARGDRPSVFSSTSASPRGACRRRRATSRASSPGTATSVMTDLAASLFAGLWRAMR